MPGKKANEDSSKGKGPNEYPEAKTKAQLAAVQSTCRYLGKTFYEGDTICYRGGRWECSGGSWVDLNQSC